MANMGMGELGRPDIILKKKFRFALEFETPVGKIERHFVKNASRPSLEIDESEIYFLNGYATIPGRGKWTPINVTYYDVAHKDMKPLYEWVARVYDYTVKEEGLGHIGQSEKIGWAGKGILYMYDGCGTVLETWTMYDCWPKSISFGDLNFADNDIATIDLTINYRYARMEGSICVPTPVGSCKGCS